MASVEELFQAYDDVINDGVRRGMLHHILDDESLDGRLITLDGRRLVNFGSCSYLGLETHPSLRAAVVEAVERYGTQVSSSRTYLSAPGYRIAEHLLEQAFGRPTVITSSTSLGHVAVLPTLVGSADAFLMDHQAHFSMQTAAKLAQAQGTVVELIPHNNLRALERRIDELSRTRRRIWYALDGIYSMYADLAPFDELNELVERQPKLWLYVDDAHAFSWTGTHGRGVALEQLSPLALGRAVVAGSLNKSFAASGGAFTFADPETRRRVFTIGGPLVFSGPVQPPMLGAIIASARLHLSDEVVGRQQRLLDLIRLFNRAAEAEGIPLISPSEAPIRCVGIGTPQMAYNLSRRLWDAGYFVNTATLPAVPAKRSGVRIALTTHHTDADIEQLVDAIAVALPRALAEEGGTEETLRRAFTRQLGGRPVRLRAPGTVLEVGGRRLRLERHTTIDTVGAAEWDGLLGDRGAFDWSGLRALERAFAGVADRREDRWDFHYWLVRDTAGRPVAATFFTTTLWKDDMLTATEVSAEVERLRRADPYHLTSVVVGMGSLLTEGDHLYLDRTADWRGALRLILAEARAEEDRSGASGIALRDLPDDDPELHEFLLGEGFMRFAVPDTWQLRVDFTDEAGFLTRLPKKARYHQRTRVLSWEPKYQIRRYAGGSAQALGLGPAELDHLYRLYRAVHARGLRLNVFPLPRPVLDAVLAQPGWELVTLRLIDGPAEPVAFAVQHVTADHVQPVFVGLDYDHVAEHNAYQQTLWQAVRSAMRRGSARVLFGMGADLQKSRFGASPVRRWVYLQATEGFNLDVLHQLAETTRHRPAA